tara:strand:- start:145 stop:444 length:300 start_codon:yes stop_codon:yes gene_type:complete
MVLKRQIMELGSIFTILFVAFYFSVTALYGEYGLFNLFQKQGEEKHLLEMKSQLEIEIKKWENLTTRMSSNFLDLDLLDEQARKILRVAKSTEAIFFNK